VKITSLNKSLAAVVILFFFILGAFAVSLAHEAPATAAFQSVEMRLFLADAPEQLHGHGVDVVWQFPTCDVAGMQATDLDPSRFAGHRFTALTISAGPLHRRTPKVSLQILQSILLI